jgi:hypothetical protein
VLDDPRASIRNAMQEESLPLHAVPGEGDPEERSDEGDAEEQSDVVD